MSDTNNEHNIKEKYILIKMTTSTSLISTNRI